MRPRRRCSAAIAAALALGGCGEQGPPEPIAVDETVHAAAIEAFAAARVSELSAPDSWLSLIGLYWLPQGETSIGAAEDSGVVLPPPAQPRVGTLVVSGRDVHWRTEPGVRVTQGVDSTLALPAGTGAIEQDASGDPTVEEADLTADLGEGKSVVLRHGELNWIVIRRGDEVALRLRDNANVAYRAFQGIERYPTASTWRVTARWLPQEKTVSIPNVLGTVSDVVSPAALEFWVDGRRMTLDVPGEEEFGRYMLVFADQTSGGETYGGGRYLWVDGPDDQGRVVVDFNLAYNPPCVWTAFATCPLPTRDNRLDIRVEAGEKNWKH